MVRANALYIVVVISLVIGVLCTSIILLSYYYRISLIDFQVDQRLSANLNSAITLALASESNTEKKVLDLYGEGKDSVFIESATWGVFDLGIVSAFSGRKVKKAAFLAGYKPAGIINSALYLTDQHRPVSLSGKTLIKGDAYLPKAGVKRAYIGGRSFEGKNLVNGNIKNSSSTLPKINQKQLNDLEVFFTPAITAGAKVISFEDFNPGQAVNNSFSDSTLVIQSSLPVRINYALSGKIIIQSQTLIEIASGSKLKDVVLTAPAIRILSGVEGTFQAFARDSLYIEPNVTLNYPSAVGLISASGSKIPFIKIEESVNIKGIVFVINKAGSIKEPFFKMGKNSVITGHVYSDGYAEIRGSILGHLSANKTYLNTGGGVYENHIMDAVLDQSQLPNQFIGSSLLPCEKKKRLVKWLND